MSYHLPIIHPTPPLTYLSTISSGLLWWLDPNDCPDPNPTTTVSPEVRRVRLTNCIQLDTGKSENKPWREWDTDSVWGVVENYAQHLHDVMIRIWHFPLPIEAYLPYGRPVFFSHILLINLVQAKMGPATIYFLYCPGVWCPSYSTFHIWYRIVLPLLYLPRAPVWRYSAK